MTFTPPDYSRLRRHKDDTAALAKLGLASVDDLVTVVNERRLKDGKRPLPHGDFPSNKPTFEKLLREFQGYRPDEASLLARVSA